MPHTIVSPVKRWPGQIVLSSPLSWPQYAAWWGALQSVTDGKPSLSNAELLSDPRLVQQMLPGVLACVERWELGGGFTPDPFPATPTQSALQLLACLIAAITELVTEEDASPPA